MTSIPRVQEREVRGSQETSNTQPTTNFANGGAIRKKECDENASKDIDESTARGADQIEGNNPIYTLNTYIQRQQCDAKELNLQEIEDLLDKQQQKIIQLERETAAQIQILKKQLQEKDEKINRLQIKATEAASKAPEMSVGPSLLRLPESEIIKSWKALHYEVRNFVMNYLKNAGDGKMQRWTDSQALLLREITPSYQKFAMDRRCGNSLIEAAIWSTLMRLVFSDSATSGSICWAGRYAGKVSKLSGALYREIDRDRPADSEKLKAFHQWKATTASLLSALGPHNGRDDKITEIVEELEDLVEPFRSKLSRDPVHQTLQNLTLNAVALDESFCGQHEWYYLEYPKLNGDAAFVIRPRLCRAGGRGKNYGQISHLDPSVVWSFASQRP
jgi:DNA-binding transcriptional MerR regulator